MKITKKELRNIIKEELTQVLEQGFGKVASRLAKGKVKARVKPTGKAVNSMDDILKFNQDVEPKNMVFGDFQYPGDRVMPGNRVKYTSFIQQYKPTLKSKASEIANLESGKQLRIPYLEDARDVLFITRMPDGKLKVSGAYN